MYLNNMVMRMSKKTKKCIVCGREFVPCQTRIEGTYQWRRICCSQDCAKINLARYSDAYTDTSGTAVIDTESIVQDNTENIQTDIDNY